MATRTDDAAAEYTSIDHFSLMEGGPLHQLARTLGFPPGRAGFVRLGVGLALLTWLPLVVLTAFARMLTSGPVIPFTESTGTHVRLLVAIPLFFVAEATFDPRIRQVLHELARHLVPSAQLTRLTAAVLRAARWRDGWIVEAAIVVVTILLASTGTRTDATLDVSTWRNTAGGNYTAAGWWYVAACMPVFQFLMLRWGARLLIWGYLLFSFLRLDLRLIPTHPDAAGGLGALGVAQVGLAPLSFALSAVLVGTYAEQVAHGLAEIQRIVMPLASMMVANVLLISAPLFLFTPRLIETKRRGLVDYGGLASDYTRAFDAKWLRQQPPPSEPLLGSADVQSLADLANAFKNIGDMKLVPFSGAQALILAGAAALPAAPLILFVVPFDQLIIRGVRTIFQI